MRSNKGITLVALVITIIILIILAGITISMVLGEDGLIGKAKKGANEYKNAAANEQTLLGQINELFEGNGSTSGGTTQPQKTGASVKLKNGTAVTITTENISEYIGEEVDYTPAAGGTWRIFYLDTENKYGDGANTLFIKRDSVHFYDNDYLTYTSETAAAWLAKFNPEWADKDNNISENNERLSSYLCDSENWNADYKSTDGVNKARYAIGSPSVEMYMDAYNQWGEYTSGTGPQSYKYVSGEYGYSVGVNGTYSNDGNFQTNNSLSAGPNNIFLQSAVDSTFILCSPSRTGSDYAMRIYKSLKYVGNYWNTGACSIEPVVSLQ